MDYANVSFLGFWYGSSGGVLQSFVGLHVVHGAQVSWQSWN